MKNLRIITLISACLFIGNLFGEEANLSEGPNLIKNGSFSMQTEGIPDFWKLYMIDGLLSYNPEFGLAITVSSIGKVGSIAQTITGISGGQTFVFEAMVKSTVPDMAYLQIKLKQGKALTLERINSSKSTEDWSKLRIELSSAEADTLSLQCRYNRNEGTLNQTFYIRDVALYEVR